MNVLDVFADNLQRIDQASQGDDGSAVLVIVEDRDVADFFELLLDVEALWGLDVLEVDAAEGWLHEFYRLNDLVRILGVQADRESVYARKGFKQNRFAFHNCRPAPAPMSPRPSTAVPLVTTATMLPFAVYS